MLTTVFHTPYCHIRRKCTTTTPPFGIKRLLGLLEMVRSTIHPIVTFTVLDVCIFLFEHSIGAFLTSINFLFIEESRSIFFSCVAFTRMFTSWAVLSFLSFNSFIILGMFQEP